MINYSYYPFLQNARRTITTLDEQCVLYARDNIEKYTPTEILQLDISVFLASTIILRNLNNNLLTRKFVNNFGKLFESKILKDIFNKEIRMEVLQYFDVKNDIEFIFVNKSRLVKIHLLPYLDIQQHVNNDQNKALQLVNQVLDRGFVIIELERFVYLMRLALEHRLFDKIKAMKEYKDNEIINRCVNEELKPKYPEYIKKDDNNDGIIAPNIQQLIDKAYKEHHLDHNERIRLGIYLQKHGYDMDYIVEIFKQLSDFDPKITAYQLQSLKRYIK